MIRVLLVTSAREVGGAEKYVQRLIHEARSSCEFTVILSDHPNMDGLTTDVAREGAQILRCKIDSLGHLPSVIRKLSALSKYHDVIHLNSNHPASRLGIALGYFLSKTKRPVVCVEQRVTEVDDVVVPGYMRPFIPAAFRASRAQVTKIISVSRENASKLHDLYGIQPDKISVVHNGVDLITELGTSTSTQSLRGELCLSENAKLILVLAKLNPNKGHHYLIQASPEILSVHPEAHFIFAGDGTHQAALEAEVASMGFKGKFHFLGLRADTQRLLAESDVFVLPSLAEGFSLALIEALNAGLPVIATEVGGAPEVIEDGVNGFLVPPANPSLLAEYVTRVLSLQTQEIERLRTAAQNSSLAFSSASMASKTVAVYQKAIAEFNA
jgi:glycosyltransferase involved in cell wall biosynthesis